MHQFPQESDPVIDAAVLQNPRDLSTADVTKVEHEGRDIGRSNRIVLINILQCSSLDMSSPSPVFSPFYSYLTPEHNKLFWQ